MSSVNHLRREENISIRRWLNRHIVGPWVGIVLLTTALVVILVGLMEFSDWVTPSPPPGYSVATQIESVLIPIETIPIPPSMGEKSLAAILTGMNPQESPEETLKVYEAILKEIVRSRQETLSVQIEERIEPEDCPVGDWPVLRYDASKGWHEMLCSSSDRLRRSSLNGSYVD